MGVLAARAEDNELAIEWFRKAVAADWLNSIFPLGKLLQESGDMQGALKIYNQGIVRGCADSMHAMSELILDKEISRLYENAHDWCERAVAQGHLGAHMQLARMYHEGLGVQPDPRQAVSLWLRAAWQGHRGAQLMIGMACDVGRVLKEDRVAAMRFLSASAAHGYDAAEACLSSVERKLTREERARFEADPILGTRPDSEASTNAPPSHLLWAAEAGDVESQNYVGVWYSNNQPDTAQAVMWFSRAADQGDGNAFHSLGIEAFNSGDMPLATEWYKKAIAAGVRDSLYNLGWILNENGETAKALELFQQGAERNCPSSQCALGSYAFYEKTPESYKKARYWDEKAAMQGVADSQARLGTMYHEGLGVEPNEEEAIHWWQQAARQGHHIALYKMGVARHKGTGIAKDLLAAMLFLRASAAHGNADAKNYLPQVEAELTPEEKLELEA